MKKIVLPITNTGRKYGYITWQKNYDADIKKIFGNKEKIDLVINKKVTKKAIDWKRRRIAITYTLTRNLYTTVKTYTISQKNDGKFSLSFT